jgi:hypothetical protein
MLALFKKGFLNQKNKKKTRERERESFPLIKNLGGFLFMVLFCFVVVYFGATRDQVSEYILVLRGKYYKLLR